MRNFKKNFLSIDLVAGVGAAGFAIAAYYYEALVALASPEVAGAFSLFALGRWYAGRTTREEVPDA